MLTTGFFNMVDNSTDNCRYGVNLDEFAGICEGIFAEIQFGCWRMFCLGSLCRLYTW